jgi:hypothetical protein
MAWSRQDELGIPDDRIYWSPNTETIGGTPQWGPMGELSDRRTSARVAISAVGPGGCMAWKGSGADNHIWYSLWDTAAGTWGEQVATPFQTPHFPALAQYREHTFMFWSNSTPDDQGQGEIAWAELINGYWVAPFRPDIDWSSRLLTRDGGAIAADGVTTAWDTHMDTLYIAWRQRDSDTAMQWMGLDSSGWDKQPGTLTLSSATANDPPALASDGNLLYLAWRNSDDTISWTWSVSGNWTTPQRLGDRRTSAGPALAALSTSDIVMAWKGAGADPHIWWSRLPGSVWAGWQEQQALPDQRIHANLQPTLWAPALGN